MLRRNPQTGKMEETNPEKDDSKKLEDLKSQLDAAQEALDFLIMNGGM